MSSTTLTFADKTKLVVDYEYADGVLEITEVFVPATVNYLGDITTLMAEVPELYKYIHDMVASKPDVQETIDDIDSGRAAYSAHIDQLIHERKLTEGSQ